MAHKIVFIIHFVYLINEKILFASGRKIKNVLLLISVLLLKIFFLKSVILIKVRNKIS